MRIKSFLTIGGTLFIALVFVGCAATQTSVPEGVETESWQLELTEQTQGMLEMTLWRQEIHSGSFKVGGTITGKIEDHLGGTGNLKLSIDGTIENNILKAKLNGNAKLSEGPSSVTGTIKGTISHSEGLGTYSTKNKLGISAGNYKITKI